jgi:chromate transporter
MAMLALRGNADLYHMGEFFTKAAFLTIGGAYAVLPYVYQGGVEHYGWLTGTADDGRPGAGRNHAGAADHDRHLGRLSSVAWPRRWPVAPSASGLAGSPAVATFFTFLPSFLFILAGGPLVEASRDDIKFTAPLTGITAAVVGVILNLATFLRLAHLLAAGHPAAPFLRRLRGCPGPTDRRRRLPRTCGSTSRTS